MCFWAPRMIQLNYFNKQTLWFKTIINMSDIAERVWKVDDDAFKLKRVLETFCQKWFFQRSHDFPDQLVDDFTRCSCWFQMPDLKLIRKSQPASFPPFFNELINFIFAIKSGERKIDFCATSSDCVAGCDPCVVIISNAYLKLYAEQVSKQAREKNNCYCKLHCGIHFGKAKKSQQGDRFVVNCHLIILSGTYFLSLN